VFRRLPSIEEARRLLKKSYTPKPLGKEQVSLSEALNRILAEDIAASIEVPPFNRSTVDGYAVRAEDTFGADEDRPKKLKICGRVNVGETPTVKVERGMAAEIFTGAPLSSGADSVVMVENTTRRGDTVLIHEAVSRRENVMKAGSDIRRGETILRKGQKLSPREVGVLAALGIAKVKVHKRPRAAVLSTGAEVVEPGNPLPDGKIYDINAHALSAAVWECGGEPLNMGIVQDEPQRMEAALRNALHSADVVITSGGVSVGPTDIIPKVLNALGKPGVIVYGIAMKPGKPTTIAVVDRKPVFSLPGHPASALLAFHLFVRPVIIAMSGGREEAPNVVRATTATKIFSARGRRTFVTVNLKRDKSGRFVASPVPLGLSGAITTLAKADGFIEIHESRQFVDAGEEVTVWLFKQSPLE